MEEHITLQLSVKLASTRRTSEVGFWKDLDT